MIKKILLMLIIFYKKCISPYTPPVCRFHPTCSTYMFEAISRYGVLRGLALGIKRLLRCNPFCKTSGYDPVP